MAVHPQFKWFQGDNGRRAIDHVFMPRQLPEKFDSLEEHRPELCLYAMLDCVSDLPDDVCLNYIPCTKQMLSEWASLQRSVLDFSRIKDALNNTKHKVLLALYLVAQNATIVIRQQDDHIKVWAFDVHAQSALLTQAPQALYGVFPRAAVRGSPDVILTSDFAHQLFQLHSFPFNNAQRTSFKHGVEVTETRDATDPKYVFEWLLSAVATEVDPTAPRLEKKVRDTVVYTKGELPWRRSGIYLSLKWVLHASLVAELGHVSGTCFYKACVLKIACRLAAEQYANVDLDLRQQMLNKCARKLSKLELLLEKESPKLTNVQLKQTCLEIIRAAHGTLSFLNEFSKILWEGYQETWRKESDWVLEPGSLDLQADIEQQLPKSKTFLLKSINREASDNQVAVEKAVTTFTTEWANPSNRLWILHNEEEETFQRFMSSTTVTSLFSSLDLYIERANSYYDDPYGWSRKILCIYCKVAMIDRVVCQELPILKEHSTDVDPSYLRYLVLVDSNLLKVLEKVESYFANRNKSKYPGPLEEKVSPNSLAVRFAAQCDSMEQTRQQILAESAKQEQAKREEIRRAEQYVANLRKKAGASQHEYSKEFDFTDRVFKDVHKRECNRCRYEEEMQSYSMELYEHLLPERVDYQRAIVFELTSLPNVNLWWDAVLLANRAVKAYEPQNLKIHLHWSTSHV